MVSRMKRHKGHDNVGRTDQGKRLKEKYGEDYFRNIRRKVRPENEKLTALLGGMAHARKIAANPKWQSPTKGKHWKRNKNELPPIMPQLITCSCGTKHYFELVAKCVKCCSCGQDVWYIPQ